MDFSAISSAALGVIARLEARGFEAYLVGGCVRDLLRGVLPHDFDVATSAIPEETVEVFRDLRTIETGIAHGTVTVLWDSEPIEVTTYRVDGDYTDHRRPDSVSFTPSLTEDLARRDFTVNAMAYSPTRGFCDPFGGRADIESRILRAVGDPRRRFSEDALRILRALRFASTLGFSIEPVTGDAARALALSVSSVAAERIREELVKLLCGDGVADVLSQYGDILDAVLPEASRGEVSADLPKDPICRLAAFLGSCRSPEAMLKRLRVDNATSRAVMSLLALSQGDLPTDKAELCRLLRKEGIEALERAFSFRRVLGCKDKITQDLFNEILAAGEPYLLSHLNVDGHELCALGIPSGPLLGRILETLYGAVIEGRISNEKERLMRAAMAVYCEEVK